MNEEMTFKMVDENGNEKECEVKRNVENGNIAIIDFEGF